MSVEDEIVFEIEGRLALITLNRPDQLNALTLDMVLAIDAHLVDYASDDAIDAVLIKGTGDGLFCAGGDIRRIYDAGRNEESYPYEFFRGEYRMNARIFHFSKPYIALMDGIVMGGGLGLSVHGSHRIVSENLVLAMPETGIGLFPDVGGSYFLSRLPGATGMYLAMTGARLNAADALGLGIGDQFVESAEMEALEAALIDGDLAGGAAAVEAVIGKFANPAEASELIDHREAIDRCFATDTVEDIFATLMREEGDWAKTQLQALAGKSPTSMKLTHRQILNGAGLSFDECMRMEYRIANGCVRGHDFYEGVRALLIDKDRSPKWDPSAFADVQEADIATYFEAEPVGGDLSLPD